MVGWLPVARRELEAFDEDAVAAVLADVYGPEGVTTTPPTDAAPHLRLVSTSAGQLRADRITSSFALTAAIAALPVLKIYHALLGQARVRVWGVDHALAPGESLLVPAGVPSHLETTGGDCVVLILPFERVAEVARQHAGVRPGGFRFTDLRPVNRSREHHWARTLRLVESALEPPDPLAAHPLVNAQLVETTALAALTTFPNTAMTAAFVPAPGRAGTASLTRAMAFIEEHADRPLTLDEIAAAAGTGSRALQAAFRRHRGTTPHAFLRDVRLARAHADLLAADPDAEDAVAAIAERWWFARTDRFTAAYRRTYGCSPGQTLRGPDR